MSASGTGCVIVTKNGKRRMEMETETLDLAIERVVAIWVVTTIATSYPNITNPGHIDALLAQSTFVCKMHETESADMCGAGQAEGWPGTIAWASIHRRLQCLHGRL